MTAMLPVRRRVYHHHILDSRRWDAFEPRPDDVVITTSLKTGTTWTQRILSLLIFGEGPLAATLDQLSPWLDARTDGPPEAALARLEAQQHRRFIKSHLPLDALPYYPEVRYVFVCRDTRDVFMSLWNHYSSYTDAAYERYGSGDPPGGPLPRAPGSPGEFWHAFITRGSFAWEQDGWPFWSHHHHASSFWQFRHLPNILFVHFADLLADLEGEMRRIAAFARLDVEAAAWPRLVELARFENMRAQSGQLLAGIEQAFKGGATTFINKGTNGRWRDVLGEDDLALYERAAARLDPGLRRWMEGGRLVAGDPQIG